MALTPQKISEMANATIPAALTDLLYIVQGANGSRKITLKDAIFSACVTGTWTPTIGGATTDPTLTYTVQQGNYCKLGKFVFVQFRVDANITDIGAGGLVVRGLPYTPAWSLIGFDVGLQTLLTSAGVIGDLSGINIRILTLDGQVATTSILKIGAGILSGSAIYVTNTN